MTDAVQKAFIEVDQAGSKASARRSVVEDSKKGEARRPLKRKQRPVPFMADHPFLFQMRDVQTGLLLFQGRVVKPIDFLQTIDILN